MADEEKEVLLSFEIDENELKMLLGVLTFCGLMTLGVEPSSELKESFVIHKQEYMKLTKKLFELSTEAESRQMTLQ